MREIRCPSCHRLLCKQDSDGTIHIKTGRSGTQVIAKGGRIDLICPSSFFKNDKERVVCGSRFILREEEVCLAVA